MHLSAGNGDGTMIVGELNHPCGRQDRSSVVPPCLWLHFGVVPDSRAQLAAMSHAADDSNLAPILCRMTLLILILATVPALIPYIDAA